MLAHPAPPRPHPSTRRLPPVLGAEVFRSVVIRERKRAERSGGCMLLVLVESTRERAEPSWPTVIGRLATVMDATDVIGWYEPGAVLGLVHSTTTADVPQSPGAGASSALAARLERTLGRECSVRAFIHPEQVGPVDGDLRAIEPRLYPELVFRRRADRFRDAGKRTLDIVGSALALVLLAPALIVIAALVKLTSPGPALFAQTRVGHRAKLFTARKFRTMHAHADPAVHREFVSRFIRAGGDDAPPATGVFKLTNDLRITPLGRLLRKTSLDELPQLWNVLCGEMSLVGPRPPVPYEYAQYRPWHRRRVIDAKPGLTGLWQVTGRSRTTFDEMVRLDLRYARTRSFRTDLVIIGRTPPVVICGKGAC
jgi:lipopolysaccharide/colanic/teichoic acid biosynthesis glycosyltransferase